ARLCFHLAETGASARLLLGLAGGKSLQDFASELLQFAEAREVILEFSVHALRFLRAELRAEDHVAQFDWMREQSIFLQLFQSGFGVVVVHACPRLLGIVDHCTAWGCWR